MRFDRSGARCYVIPHAGSAQRRAPRDPDGPTVAGLLVHLGVKAPRVAVEVDEKVVTKDRYEAQRIGARRLGRDVAFVGGG